MSFFEEKSLTHLKQLNTMMCKQMKKKFENNTFFCHIFVNVKVANHVEIDHFFSKIIKIHV